MAQVTILHGTDATTVSAQTGETLGTVLRREIPSFAMPCNGNHTCGKCLVLTDGAVSAMEEEERKLLAAREAPSSMRLACFCRVEGDVTVTLPGSGPAKILAWYKTPEISATETGAGFAVDIGTTTVAVQLIERATGRVLAERVAENAQRGFGADVISRIEACGREGVQTLSDRITRQLEEMATACLQESGVTAVEESVVTGNTTMLHLYEGIDPAPLSVAPFTVPSYFGCMSHHTLAGAPVYLPRCIGAYVGADITCAIMASALPERGTLLLADIGTNGEIVLARDGKLLCCSTAAGPAFEGAELRHGMPAAAGAIRAVRLENNEVAYETVHNSPAVGICGSGVLDALAVMLETDAMDETGYVEEDWEIGNSGIAVTQRDVRQIQLAKSAICGGILTLMEAEDLRGEHVDHFVVAGGFGSAMNQTSAAAIGLYPAALQEKAEFLGNGALGGAVMLLRSRPLREAAEELAKAAEELSLSASEEFMDYYIDCMSFGIF